jgi:hypothetical protein
MSDLPVHANLTDFQRFAPSAINAGWMDIPLAPRLEFGVTPSVTFDDNSGLTSSDNLLELYTVLSPELVFVVSAGAWVISVRYLAGDPEQYVVKQYTYSLDVTGEIAFGFLFINNVFLACQGDTDHEVRLWLSSPVRLVDQIHLSGPTRDPASNFLACTGYFGRQIRVVQQHR